VAKFLKALRPTVSVGQAFVGRLHAFELLLVAVVGVRVDLFDTLAIRLFDRAFVGIGFDPENL
jgi:hypothetical protein